MKKLLSGRWQALNDGDRQVGVSCCSISAPEVAPGHARPAVALPPAHQRVEE